MKKKIELSEDEAVAVSFALGYVTATVERGHVKLDDGTVICPDTLASVQRKIVKQFPGCGVEPSGGEEKS